MVSINENYLKLEENYLFSQIAKKVEKFRSENPEIKLIKMGIGDITRPIANCVIQEMQKAIQEQEYKETLKGYGPEQGYEFLRKSILQNEYESLGISFDLDEIFIADGTKCDIGNMIEIFDKDNSVGIMDPVYPVYKDSNIMNGTKEIVLLNATKENDFKPQIPNRKIDIIYLCFPNNPTGTVLTRKELKQWVDYALENNSILFYDGAYEAFIQEDEIPHSIYEIENAKKVAIEFRSFSKTAGFTGLRCSYVLIPKELEVVNSIGRKFSVGSFWKRRQSTKFNGTAYIVQRGANAIYTKEGKQQIKQNIQYYLENAKIIREVLIQKQYPVYGGVNSPYVWLEIPKKYTSWEFFSYLLENYGIIGTPGIGFGNNGEGYFRLTAFGSKEDTIEAMEKMPEYMVG